MMNLEFLKDYPYAQKYFCSQDGLNIKSFPRPMLRKFLNEISVDDIKYLNKIYQWKEQIEQGLDTPFPFKDLNLKRPKSFKSDTLWKTVGIICIISIITFFIIIGFFIWGDLKLLNDYHFLVIPFIIIIICLSIRFFIHIKIVKNVRFIERVFPFAAQKLSLNSNFAARCLFMTEIEDLIEEYHCPNMSYLLLLNSNLSIFYNLLKRAISLYPDKILLYYQYGEHNSTVISYSKRPIFGVFRMTYENYNYHYINIFNVFLNIEKKNNLEFLLSILSKSKIEKIKNITLRDDLVKFFNSNKHCLLDEGYRYPSLSFTESKIFEDRIISYKFWKDWRFKTYAYILLILLPISLLFYPFYFRYNYVHNELAKKEYQMLMNDYQANCKRLYDLDAVNLVVSVSNNLVYNNHVGHSWGTSNLINNTHINNKTTISYHYGEPISLYTEIVEYDNWSDVSRKTETISYSKEELINGVNVSVDSYVFENRGRYSGNCAKWTSTYHIEVEKPNKPVYQNIKISSSEVLSHFFN